MPDSLYQPVSKDPAAIGRIELGRLGYESTVCPLFQFVKQQPICELHDLKLKTEASLPVEKGVFSAVS